jgi:hypothetical protein
MSKRDEISGETAANFSRLLLSKRDVFLPVGRGLVPTQKDLVDRAAISKKCVAVRFPSAISHVLQFDPPRSAL